MTIGPGADHNRDTALFFCVADSTYPVTVTSAESLPPTPEYGPVPQYPIESVDNALRVLLLLGEEPNPDGQIVLVGTPIGNLGDVTLRGEFAGRADEDGITRISGGS